MRILHTSDWHLGRGLHGVDLLTAQAAFTDHLVEVIVGERVDVLLVAGDVYDRALPGVDAVRLLDETLARVRAAGAQVVLSSGNHDSPHRLGFAAGLLTAAGVHLRTDPAAVAEPVILHDRHGPVAFYPLPYLEPITAAAALGCSQARPDHPQVLAAAMNAVRADLAARPGVRSVVAAHAFVSGGQECDSERPLSVGTIGQTGLRTFAGPDYLALGHLHGRQQLAPWARYSGSPLAFSFSEAQHRKGSWLVELDADGLADVHPVEAPVPRALRRLSGTLSDLLTSSAHGSAEDAWCQVTLTDAERPRAPMEQLRRRFPHLLELRFAPPQRPARAYPQGAGQQPRPDDLELCCSFLDHVRGRSADEQERALLARALQQGIQDLVDEQAGAPSTQPLWDDLDLLTPQRPVNRSGRRSA